MPVLFVQVNTMLAGMAQGASLGAELETALSLVDDRDREVRMNLDVHLDTWF